MQLLNLVSHTQENFLPTDQGEGLVLVLAQFDSPRQTTAQLTLKCRISSDGLLCEL